MMMTLIDNYSDPSDLAIQVAACLPQEVQRGIEQQYYEQVNAKAKLDCLLKDPGFLANPAKHVGLFSDHGVVHARDVAKQIIHVLDNGNGVLIPKRDEHHLRFMKGYGVMMAYLHDIGMSNLTYFGRVMHPEFATQEVFSSRFDGWIEILWNENGGNFAWRLTHLADQGALQQDPMLVLREMLAMGNCHNKGKVPVETLNDLQKLRRVMLLSLGTDLDWIYVNQRRDKARRELQEAIQSGRSAEEIAQRERDLQAAEIEWHQRGGDESPDKHPNPAARQYYSDAGHDFQQQAFQWLVSGHEALRPLIHDVVDTLRCLRCADALRQRGTVLRTSGGYQIFVNRTTANAMYALRKENGETYLLATDNVMGGGEANTASSELTPEGDLRFSFYRGQFPGPEIVARAVRNAAETVNDVQTDVIQSFVRTPAEADQSEGYCRSAQDIKILLEEVDDNWEFADMVRREVERVNPSLIGRIRTAPSLRQATAHERSRYLSAEEIRWDMPLRLELFARMADMGYKTRDIDPALAFIDVKCILLQAGESLVEAGTPSGFVYVPLGEGLKVIQLGGYDPLLAAAFVPLGDTGVIRGEERNATVIAERDVRVLVIPSGTYFRHWHDAYSCEEFLKVVAEPQKAAE